MVYKVKARRFGNAVEYQVKAADIKEALEAAKKEARHIFEYDGLGEPPTVDVKLK